MNEYTKILKNIPKEHTLKVKTLIKIIVECTHKHCINEKNKDKVVEQNAQVDGVKVVGRTAKDKHNP